MIVIAASLADASFPWCCCQWFLSGAASAAVPSITLTGSSTKPPSSVSAVHTSDTELPEHTVAGFSVPREDREKMPPRREAQEPP